MTTLSQTLAPGRRNSVTLVRLLLALGVVFTHSFNLLLGDNTDPLGLASGGRVGLAGTCVDLFFVLSGVLITASWHQSTGVLDYLARRVLRIYPAFLLVAAAMLLIIGPIVVGSGWWGSTSWLRPIAATLTLRPTGLAPFAGQPFADLNGSLWTIHYEFLAYLALAALGLTGLLRRRPVVLAAFVVTVLLAVLQAKLPTPLLSDTDLPLIDRIDVLPRFASCFLGGVVLFLYRDKVPMARRWAMLALVTSIALIAADLTALATPTTLGYLVLWLGLAGRPMSLTGRADLSYGVYLSSYPITQLIVRYVPHHLLSGLSVFAASAVGSLAVAAVSWRFVEHPALRQKARLDEVRRSGSGSGRGRKAVAAATTP